MTTDLQHLAEMGSELADGSARLAKLGWMRGSSGNLSTVLQTNPLRLLVTASGLDKGALTAEDTVVVDSQGAAVPDQPRPDQTPSAEAALHAEIVEVSGAGAVVHVHALSAVHAAHRWPDGVELHDLEMLKGLGRRAEADTVLIPVIANSQQMHVLGERFRKSFDPDVPALLIARHGMYVWGKDLIEARLRTECLEWLLRYALVSDSP